jgi:hypothetical protein
VKAAFLYCEIHTQLTFVWCPLCALPSVEREQLSFPSEAVGPMLVPIIEKYIRRKQDAVAALTADLKLVEPFEQDRLSS